MSCRDCHLTPSLDHTDTPLVVAHGVSLKAVDAARLNINDSVMLANGGIAVLPGVKHNLHCIASSPPTHVYFLVRFPNCLFQRRLRQSMYGSHYYPDIT